MFVLKHWIFFEDISNFKKWKSLFIDKKMLDGTESNAKGNDNFATKGISTESVEKKCGRSKKKESNFLLF